jgi:hypothetical protein
VALSWELNVTASPAQWEHSLNKTSKIQEHDYELQDLAGNVGLERWKWTYLADDFFRMLTGLPGADVGESSGFLHTYSHWNARDSVESTEVEDRESGTFGSGHVGKTSYLVSE